MAEDTADLRIRAGVEKSIANNSKCDSAISERSSVISGDYPLLGTARALYLRNTAAPFYLAIPFADDLPPPARVSRF